MPTVRTIRDANENNLRFSGVIAGDVMEHLHNKPGFPLDGEMASELQMETGCW